MSPPKHPIQVVTKPIGPVCNLGCEYCFYLAKKDLYPAGERFRMSPEVLDTYVRRLIDAQPGPDVQFTWQGGEPTLMGLDFFRRAVELQRRHLPDGWRCTNALQTNGTLLDREWGEFLAEHGFLVGISIDGPAWLHDRFRVDRRGRPTHERAMTGLRTLREHGVDHNVLCVVNAINAQDPLEVYRFFRDEGVDWLQLIPIVERVGARGISERSVTGEAWGAFLVAVFDEWVCNDVSRMFVQHFEECVRMWLGRPATLCVHAETCGLGLAMEHNGDLFACDHYVDPEHELGNITDTSLRDLADRPEQVQFGLDKRDTLPRFCRECDVRFACNGGCPKDRFALTPDGEDGLNVLCAGYARFFRHVDPYMRRLADGYRRGVPAAAIMGELAEEEAARYRSAGRNDPCPCGSGRKLKHCCSGPAEASGRRDASVPEGRA